MGFAYGILKESIKPLTIMSIYTDNGYANRKEYLEEYGEAVDELITVLPASEDFDGLVTSLEDYCF